MPVITKCLVACPRTERAEASIAGTHGSRRGRTRTVHRMDLAAGYRVEIPDVVVPWYVTEALD